MSASSAAEAPPIPEAALLADVAEQVHGQGLDDVVAPEADAVSVDEIIPAEDGCDGGYEEDTGSDNGMLIMSAPAIEEHEEMEGAAPAAATVSASASAEVGEGAAGVGAASPSGSADGGAVEKQAALDAQTEVKQEGVSQGAKEPMRHAAWKHASVTASASAEAGEGAAGVGAASASGGAVEKQEELEALIQVKLEAVSQEAEEAMQHAASIATWADSSPTAVPPIPWIGMDDVWVQLASSITVKDTTLARADSPLSVASVASQPHQAITFKHDTSEHRVVTCFFLFACGTKVRESQRPLPPAPTPLPRAAVMLRDTSLLARCRDLWPWTGSSAHLWCTPSGMCSSQSRLLTTPWVCP